MKKIVRVSVDLHDPSSFPKGFVDKKLLDATSERRSFLGDHSKLGAG